MNRSLSDKLYGEGLLSGSSYEKIKAQHEKQLFSVHWETRTILYLGILLVTGGLSILVYKNIDTLTHQAVLGFIGLVCSVSFFYCFKTKLPFSLSQVKVPNAFFDYVLLLGCLMFITFIAYFQYQYNVFGNRYGLATFIPMIVLFLTAYYFDHLGILSLAITNLAAWVEISVTPLHILEANDFNDAGIIYSGILLGIFLVLMGLLSVKKKFKAHFGFTYTNFGMHILFIALLAAMINFESISLIWFLLLSGVGWYFYIQSKKEKSFYYVLVATLYTYIGLSYVVVKLLSSISSLEIGIVYIGFIYFIASAVGMILFLIRTNKTLKAL